MIDAKSQEIKPADNETYSDMLDLADELPDSSPRFVLLSYPLTLVRQIYRYFLLQVTKRSDTMPLALRSAISTLRPSLLSA